MSSKDVRFRISSDFTERISSLVADGFAVRHQTNCHEFLMVRLHHMSNGNDIILKADFRNSTLKQWTNQILTHSQDYHGSLSDV